MDSELHRDIANAAARSGKSLNVWVVDELRREKDLAS